MNSQLPFEVLPQANKQIIIKLYNIVIINEGMLNINTNHKNYNFLNYEWFRRLLLPLIHLLLSDSLLSHSLLSVRIGYRIVQQTNHIKSCSLTRWRQVLSSSLLNPFPSEWVLRALIDFTLSNARRFYSSTGNLLDRKGLTTSKTMSLLTPSRPSECWGHL